MSKRKRIFVIIANIILGVIMFYTNLYFWVMEMFGDLTIHPSIIGIPVALLIFISVNAFLLRSKEVMHWLIAFGTATGTFLLITLIIEFS